MDTHELSVTITNDMKIKETKLIPKYKTTLKPSTSPTTTLRTTSVASKASPPVAEPHYSVEIFKENKSILEKPLDDHDDHPGIDIQNKKNASFFIYKYTFFSKDDSTSIYEHSESVETNVVIKLVILIIFFCVKY